MQIFETIDSTQLEAKRQIDAKNIIIEDLIITKEQTAGISTKKDFPWITKKGDLNFTAIFNNAELQKTGRIDLNWLPFCAGLAVLENISAIKPSLKVFLKWPNDTLVFQQETGEYKKINGTLCEIYKWHSLVGIGANLLHFPDTTQHFKATSIEHETGIKLDCIDFGVKVFNNLKKNIKTLQQFGFEPIKNQWKQHAYMLGEHLILKDHKKILFEDITNDGYILGKTENGDKRVVISSDEIIGPKIL